MTVKTESLPWLEIKKPEIPDLEQLRIITPAGTGPYIFHLADKTVEGSTLRDGLTRLLVEAGVVHSTEPEEILKVLEHYPDGNGKRMATGILRPGRVTG